MTETEVDIEFVKACSNILVNRTLMEVMQENMEQLGSVHLLKKIWNTQRSLRDPGYDG